MHNAPPVSEKPGVTYTMSGNKLYYRNAELHGTDSLYVTVTRDTFDMTYSVTTSLKNKSTLVISESYAAIDKSANVVKVFNFNKEVQLEEGKSSYGVSPKNMIIKPDKIAIFYYDWSSYTFWIEERVLEKIK